MKIHYIDLIGKKYPLVFSATAQENLKNYFGGVDTADSGFGIQNINGALEILLDAGRLYCNLMGIDIPEPLPCKPSDVLDITELTELVTLIKDVITEGQKQEVEVAEPKNAEVTQKT